MANEQKRNGNVQKENRLTVFFMILFLYVLCSIHSAQAASNVPGTTVMSGVTCTAYNKLTITWKKASNATEYRIYRKESTGWKKIATVGSSVTSYTHVSSSANPIKTGTKYTYTVRAYNKNSKKLGAYDKTGKTGQTIPDKTVLSSVSGKDSDATIQWKKTGGATHYYIYYREEGSSWKRLGIVKSSVTSYTHTASAEAPLKPGTRYYYTVRSYCSNGKVFGKYDTTGLEKNIPPAKASLVSIARTSAGVKLTWRSAEGAASYLVYYKKKDGSWKRLDTVVKNDNMVMNYEHKSSSAYPLEPGETYVYTVRTYNSRLKLYGAYNTTGISIKIQPISATPTVTPKPTATPKPTPTSTPTPTPTPMPTPTPVPLSPEEYEMYYQRFCSYVPKEIEIIIDPNSTKHAVSQDFFIPVILQKENLIEVTVVNNKICGIYHYILPDYSSGIRFVSYGIPGVTKGVVKMRTPYGNMETELRIVIRKQGEQIGEEIIDPDPTPTPLPFEEFMPLL